MERRTMRAPIGALLLLCSAYASAATLNLNIAGYQSGIDGGPEQGGVTDGYFAFDFNGAKKVSKTQDAGMLAERRTMIEFYIPAMLKEPGVVVQSVTLVIPAATNGETTVLQSGSSLRLYGYSGNGQSDTTDFLNTNNLITSIANTAPPVSYNVLPHFEAVRATNNAVGFVLTTNLWGGSYALGSNPQLVVEFNSQTNTPPNVSILSPANQAQLTTGTPVIFQGSTSDAQGDAVYPINWSSSLDGAFGSGASITVGSLSIGTHVITASAMDSSGLTGQSTITVNVGSGQVAYCSARGNSSSYEWIRAVGINNWSNTSNNNTGYGDFTSNAAVPLAFGTNNATFQPGFLTGSSYPEQWRVWVDLNRDKTFGADELLYSGNGSTLMSGTLNIPASTAKGVTRMRVAMSYGSGAQPCGVFSYGEVEDYTVDIGASLPPPPSPGPAQYCASNANNNSMEWIAMIQVGNTTRSTGKGAGYNDFTSQSAIALNRGTTAVTLTPGFSGGAYAEHWRVWIDYNKDGVFDAGEVAMSVPGSSSTAFGSISVPAAALAGNTRMRVSMAYGSAPLACGSFGYGEVEDYTVSIAP